MNSELLVDALRASGRVSEEQFSRWIDAAKLMAVLDAIGREGMNVVVKIDGERSNEAVYTIVISGGRLDRSFFRKDGCDLLTLLQDAIEFYRSVVWSK